MVLNLHRNFIAPLIKAWQGLISYGMVLPDTILCFLGRHEVKDYCRYPGVGVRCAPCVVPRLSAVDTQIKNLWFFITIKDRA